MTNKNKERQDSRGRPRDEVLGQRALRWSLSGNYGALARHTVTTLVGSIPTPMTGMEERLASLTQPGGVNEYNKSHLRRR